MKRAEAEFIKELEKKAREQGRLVETEILPAWAKGVGEWLVVNPWRVLVPIAGMSYLLMRIGIGVEVRELTLAIFGGF